MESISAAQDKDKEWAFVKVIMNLWVYKMQGIWLAQELFVACQEEFYSTEIDITLWIKSCSTNVCVCARACMCAHACARALRWSDA